MPEPKETKPMSMEGLSETSLIPGIPPGDPLADEPSEQVYNTLPADRGESPEGPAVVDNAKEPEAPKVEPSKENDPNYACTRGANGSIKWTRITPEPEESIEEPMGETTRRTAVEK